MTGNARQEKYPLGLDVCTTISLEILEAFKDFVKQGTFGWIARYGPRVPSYRFTIVAKGYKRW